mmetsp:Transcript_41210/g.132474  ORF Transcript_41210/g.132474 Transcript_41210/m.132474 type:complete len:241 (+) Transcript_41210:135-857(+)
MRWLEGEKDLHVALVVRDEGEEALVRVPVGDEHLGLAAEQPLEGGVRAKQRRQLARPLLDDVGRDALHLRRRRARPRVELGDIEHGEAVPPQQPQRLPVVGLCLARQTADDVSRDGGLGHREQQRVGDGLEVLDRVLAPHRGEHRVRARLDGHVQEGVAPLVREGAADGVELAEDVRRVGHPEAEAAAGRHGRQQRLEKLRQGGAEVDAVRARVLGSEPDLGDALVESSRHARHDGGRLV